MLSVSLKFYTGIYGHEHELFIAEAPAFLPICGRGPTKDLQEKDKDKTIILKNIFAIIFNLKQKFILKKNSKTTIIK